MPPVSLTAVFTSVERIGATGGPRARRFSKSTVDRIDEIAYRPG